MTESTPGSVAGETGRALIVHPETTLKRGRGRSAQAGLDEAIGLAGAIELDIVHTRIVRVSRINPATFLGAGIVAELKAAIEENEAGIAIVDTTLSPVQQRNLEKAWNCKVIDRTGLILEIFGARARTREGRLQVDLAALNYQRTRLVRSWTHLERQRGGAGFLGGPGESQLELDRRRIDERIVRLERDLEDVKRTRSLHREARKRVPYPVVALVGYTNAGKSTLFNRLTAAHVVARDQLFATLDPTMRVVKLPSRRHVILSDTVGFISELPTQLVAAFRATLEEVLEADVILHVRDIADPESDLQNSDVRKVLAELGITAEDSRLIEVLNKVDLLDAEERDRIAQQAVRADASVVVSALTGEGEGDLLAAIDRRISRSEEVVRFAVDASNGAAIAWLYENGNVLERRDEGETANIAVGLEPADRARFERRFADALH